MESENQDPYHNDLDALLFGNTSQTRGRAFCIKNGRILKLVGIGLGAILIIGTIASLTSFLILRANGGGSVPNDPTTESPLTTTSTKLTTITTTIPTTTTMSPTTTTISPTTITTTSKPTTTMTTTSKSTTSSEKPTPEPPFHPTTNRPLPANATEVPPVSLLYMMDMIPTFTEIYCKFHIKATFKYNVGVQGHNFTSEGADSLKEAKKGAAMAANEVLFNLTYPFPKPKPTYPCIV